MSELNSLKKEIFYKFLELAGRAYVHVRYSDLARIGNRGFVGEEKTRGIVIVVNQQMKYRWDDSGLNASLVFGSNVQKCHFPAEDIVAIYAPEIKAQFIHMPPDVEEGPINLGEAQGEGEKVIKVDFKKGKR